MTAAVAVAEAVQPVKLDEVTEGILELPHHELVHLLPPMEPEERLALKLSVREHGVRTPILTWTNEKGQRFVIDGRNRIEVVNELRLEGVGETAQGEPIRLESQEFQGDPLSLLDIVLDNNLGARRHLTKSQLCAVAVLAEEMRTKYARKAKVRLNRNSDPDIRVKELANAVGVNPSGIYDALRLQREDPKLLDAVASGRMKLHHAIAEIRLRRSKMGEEGDKGDKPAGETPSNGTTGTAEVRQSGPVPDATTDRPTVYDGRKEAVPEDFAPVFASRDRFRRLKGLLKEFEDTLEGTCDGPGGMHLNMHREEAMRCLRTLSGQVTESIPYTLCEVCKGSAKVGCSKACEACHGAGYVTLKMYKEAEKAKAKVAEKAASGDAEGGEKE